MSLLSNEDEVCIAFSESSPMSTKKQMEKHYHSKLEGIYENHDKLPINDFLNKTFDSDWGWIPVGRYTDPAATTEKSNWVIDQRVVKYLYKKNGLLSKRLDEAKDADTLVAILAHTMNEELAKWLLKMHEAKMEKTPITLYHQISKPCKGIECLGQVNLDIVQSIAQHKLVFMSC